MGKNVYQISVIFMVLFCLFIGSLVTKDVENLEKALSLSDLGFIWSYASIDGWGKLNENKVANSKDEAYIILDDVIYTPSWDDWKAALQKMRDRFKAQKVSPNISSTLVGYREGKVDRKDQWELCMSILDRLGATQIETMEDNKIISMTGYTSLIDERYVTSNGLVNINVATRYNSFEDRTYIFIGSPIITIEY